jgi:hypothetical protein
MTSSIINQRIEQVIQDGFKRGANDQFFGQPIAELSLTPTELLRIREALQANFEMFAKPIANPTLGKEIKGSNPELKAISIA